MPRSEANTKGRAAAKPDYFWLYRAVIRANAPSTPEGRARAVLRLALTLTGGDGGAIVLRYGRSSWQVAAQSGLDRDEAERLRRRVSGAGQTPDTVPGSAAGPLPERWAGLVLIALKGRGPRPRARGVLAIKGAGRLSGAIRATLAEFARLAGPVLGGALDRWSLARALQMERTLLKAGRTINSSLDTEKVLTDIVSLAERVIEAEAGSLLLVNRETGRLEFRVAHGGGGEAVKGFSVGLDEGIAGWVARNRRGLIVADAQKDRRLRRDIGERTGFVTRSLLCVPLVSRGRLIGVIEVLNKAGRADGRFNPDDLELLEGLAAHAAVALENAGLYRRIQGLYMSTIQSLAEALDAKDPYTRGHSERVAALADALAKSLGCSEKSRLDIRYAALLHDIGKIGVSEAILNKPGSLTEAEMSAVRRHAEIGAAILGPVDFLSQVRELVRHHHGWFDGHGQPGGRKGENIPLGARIIAVADAYDAMTSDRVYRRALTIEECRERLFRGAGTQWDPRIVHKLLDLLN
ncbi:MAG: HD-GYP domain-containing protein [Bacillota bacterium]